MKTSITVARPSLLIACALLATSLLAGCHATTDARWTTATDTVYRWEHALPTLPVEVRGQLPNLTHEQITLAFPVHSRYANLSITLPRAWSWTRVVM